MQQSRAEAEDRPQDAIETDVAPAIAARKPGFFELRATLSGRRTAILGVIGAFGFFGIWEIGHYITPESGQRFLPSVGEVLGRLIYLFAEKAFIEDVLISCMRIFVSFFAACAIAVPLGIMMGCFASMRALINPTVSGARYLPAASFIPLLLVWFGPTDLAKMALLFIGVIFFLIALILDNTTAVQKEYVEAALTMGASRRRVVLGVVVPGRGAGDPRFHAQHDCRRLDLSGHRRDRRRPGRHRRR